MSAFDATGKPFSRPALQAHKGVFKMGQGDSVVSTNVRTRLEAAEPVDQNSEQGFVGEAVDSKLFDRSILKQDYFVELALGWFVARISSCIKSGHFVAMVSMTLSWFVFDCDCELARLVRANDVIGECSQRYLLKN